MLLKLSVGFLKDTDEDKRLLSSETTIQGKAYSDKLIRKLKDAGSFLEGICIFISMCTQF